MFIECNLRTASPQTLALGSALPRLEIMSCTRVAAKRRKVRLRRLLSPISAFWCFALLTLGLSLGSSDAQDAITPPETAELVVTSTRLPIPEEEVPASVSVITSEDFEEHQTERVSDALREVPGLSVVQSGPPGQLTSVF